MLEPGEFTETQRLTAEEFLLQLDTANDWMVWINPQIQEVELIVQDSDGKITPFWGPEPMLTDEELYKKFAADVEKLAFEKEQ